MKQEFLISKNLFKQITETKYIYQSDFIERNDIEKSINLDKITINEITHILGLTYIPENKNGNLCFATNNDELQDAFKQVFTASDLLDYIYAVLHSPTYIKQYKELQKEDFIKIPYPEDTDTFWQFVELGKTIRINKK